jgi:hypothetical protein
MKLPRRRLLQAGASAAALGAVPGVGQLAVNAQGAFDCRPLRLGGATDIVARGRSKPPSGSANPS